MQFDKTVAFSGYRLSKLPQQTHHSQDSFDDIFTIKQALLQSIKEAIQKGYESFLVGMADGFDTFAGEAVLSLKESYPYIKLICVQPFLVEKNPSLLSHADKVVTTSEKFYAGAYHKRNRYLVDNSSLLICFYDGQDGGTAYTIDYALASGKKIQNLYEATQSEVITPFHAKYHALELMLKKGAGNDERLTSTLFNSALEINPHQIEAALFAFKSPLSKGVLLADEVGLGKTIEAGLVMCQLYAEQKRKQIVICPASLRKQWALELLEKFNLQSFILESRTYKDFVNSLHVHATLDEHIIIISYNYAAKIAKELRLIPWDIVVIDEAHKLRNSYRVSNKIGQEIKFATEDSKKILLTATPLQNNLTELYGITSIIDEHIFGDIKSFREQYSPSHNLTELKERLAPFCKRTLRKDVTEYVKYTKRISIQQRFDASELEQMLYNNISYFLQEENIYAIPYRQKIITTLIIRKVLASSSRAVCQTLEAIKSRLIKIRDGIIKANANVDNFFDDDEIEIYLNTIDEDSGAETEETGSDEYQSIDKDRLEYEIKKLDEFISLANSIKTDNKALSLLEALKIGFKETKRLGASEKALIFTESRRTQEYLKAFLEENGYAGEIVLFNGQNTSKEATEIYKNWYEENKNSHRVSGSKSADKRNALIEYFANTAKICIATEAAAEGVNLQFCSLVINYDLPWNPQRIEQRIGRCHRYGQKNDVVVINFINMSNIADMRVAQLLEEKFKLFDGVFGSSDDVLGVIESGVDFEKRVLAIYQTCRTPQEIEKEFDDLQKELEDKIKKTMKDTHVKLFENFDAEVHEKLKLNIDKYLNRYSRLFWRITKHILAKYAEFYDTYNSFLLKSPLEKLRLGRYSLISKNKNGTGLYKTRHALGQYVIAQALEDNTAFGKIQFDISKYRGYKLSVVEKLKGKSGYLTLHKYSISNLEQEEYLLFSAFADDGTQINAETCQKLFDCIGTSTHYEISEEWQTKLNKEIERYAEGTLDKAHERHFLYVQEEEERLHKWAEDMIVSFEKELVNLKNQIRDTERLVRQSTNTAEHLELQTKLQELNKRKRKARTKLEENEEEVYEMRKKLIENIKKKIASQTKLEHVFTVRFEVV